MKYLDKGRNVCEDTGEQKVFGLVLYAGLSRSEERRVGKECRL